jgi:hypothetical protein
MAISPSNFSTNIGANSGATLQLKNSDATHFVNFANSAGGVMMVSANADVHLQPSFPFLIYNVNTSSTNFERLDFQWTTNVAQIWTEKGSGGGTARDLVLGADATELIRFQTGTKLGFFPSSTPEVKQTSGANLTNNVTAGGTTDQIDDFAASLYATDAATIRNDIYQLARKLKQVNDALRAYGLLT